MDRQQGEPAPKTVYVCHNCGLLFIVPLALILHMKYHENNQADLGIQPLSPMTLRALSVHGGFFNQQLHFAFQPNSLSNIISSSNQIGSTSLLNPANHLSRTPGFKLPMSTPSANNVLLNPQTPTETSSNFSVNMFNRIVCNMKNPDLQMGSNSVFSGTSSKMTSATNSKLFKPIPIKREGMTSATNSKLFKPIPIKREVKSIPVATGKTTNLTRGRFSSDRVVSTSTINKQLKRAAEQDSPHLTLTLINKRLKNMMPPPIAAEKGIEVIDLTLKL